MIESNSKRVATPLVGRLEAGWELGLVSIVTRGA
jgi:hypothetical protein